MDAIRTFIAIELPQDIRRLALEHITRLRGKLPYVRASWSSEDSLHLTLKFLGDLRADRIPSLSDAVERAARAIAPFEINVEGCGTFPPQRLPKVLWLGIGTDASGVLPSPSSAPYAEIDSLTPTSSLHSAIEAECARAGFPQEARPFHPHLTIARLRSSKGARRLADLHREIGFPPQSFTVSEVTVFKSELLKGAAKHTALSRHELSG